MTIKERGAFPPCLVKGLRQPGPFMQIIRYKHVLSGWKLFQK